MTRGLVSSVFSFPKLVMSTRSSPGREPAGTGQVDGVLEHVRIAILIPEYSCFWLRALHEGSACQFEVGLPTVATVSGLFRWTSCFPFSVVAALRPRASREGHHLRFPHTRTPVNARNYILHLIKRVFNSMLLSKKFPPPLLLKGAKETASESAAYRQSTYEPLRTAREKE
jgi:hypothetical protein